MSAFQVAALIKPEIRKTSRFFRSKPRDRNGLITHPINNSLNSEDYFDEFFSLFIVSPYLDLQLLPTHEPFRILSTWNAMLTKYTSTKRDLILKDEPILSYQRNVFLKRHEEAIIEDAFILELLYEEAKVNILTGRYPFNDYELLASIQAAIELGPYQPRVHCASYFKLKDYIYFPLHYRQLIKKTSANQSSGSVFKLFKRTVFDGNVNQANAQRVHPPPSASSLFNNPNHNQQQRSQSSPLHHFNNYQSSSRQSYLDRQRQPNQDKGTITTPYTRVVELFKSIYDHSHHHPSRIELIRGYLSKCWSLPFYGSAFFIGQIEMFTPSKIQRMVSHHLDKPILVGVNYEGIHLIDKKHARHLLSLQYDEFKYNLGHPFHSNLDVQNPSSNLIQCLFIQVTIKEQVRGAGKECKIFQIFSKSAPLIASLIKHFSSQVILTDIPDSGSFREDLVTNTKPIDKSLLGPLERICCATFNAKGECIKFQGSINVLT